MVVAAIVVILAALAVPSLTALTRGSNEGAMYTSLRSLFSSARARAAASQHYVAVRFQQDKEGRSYAVLLDEAKGTDFPGGCPSYDMICTYLTFAASPETQPIPLPKGVEVAQGDVDLQTAPDNEWVARPDDKYDPIPYVPATTFCVVFSPSGQIVRRAVHVSQRLDDPPRTADPNVPVVQWDTVFNLTATQPGGAGLFVPDILDKTKSAKSPPQNRSDPIPSPAFMGKGTNTTTDATILKPLRFMSQTSMYIYDREKRVNAGDKPFTGCIQALRVPKVSVNVYTGTPVNPLR